MGVSVVAGELEEDFRRLVGCLDVSMGYDPLSRDFMRAAVVGQMWLAVRKLGDDVEEELEGAEKYLDLYRKTGDVSYREMASDELRHSGVLIKKSLSMPDVSKERKEMLVEQDRRRVELAKAVSPVPSPSV